MFSGESSERRKLRKRTEDRGDAYGARLCWNPVAAINDESGTEGEGGRGAPSCELEASANEWAEGEVAIYSAKLGADFDWRKMTL
jgi:hypothetical protein